MLKTILGAAAVAGAAIILGSLIAQAKIEENERRLKESGSGQIESGIIEIPIADGDESSIGDTFCGLRIATEYHC